MLSCCQSTGARATKAKLPWWAAYSERAVANTTHHVTKGFMRAGKLGSGPIHVIEMAFDMASYTRKSSKSGVYPPVKGFDVVGRRQIERPLDRANLHRLLCCNPLKVARLPAGLLLVSAQIHLDHFNQMNGS